MVGEGDIGYEGGGAKCAVVADGDWLVEDCEAWVCVVVCACAEVGEGTDFGVVSDGDRAYGVEDGAFVDGDGVTDLDVPRDDDLDGGMDADAFADLGSEEAEHGVPESDHWGWGQAPEDEFADAPECPDNLGFERPRGLAGWFVWGGWAWGGRNR